MTLRVVLKSHKFNLWLTKNKIGDKMKKNRKQINPYLVGETIKVKPRMSDLGYSRGRYGVLHPLKACLNRGAFQTQGSKTLYKLNKGAYSNKLFVI